MILNLKRLDFPLENVLNEVKYMLYEGVDDFFINIPLVFYIEIM